MKKRHKKVEEKGLSISDAFLSCEEDLISPVTIKKNNKTMGRLLQETYYILYT